jgi:hypothetical protein
MTPGAGCSITSTVSTTGVTGAFTFRMAFFAGAYLGFALATVRFAALDTLRALPRLAEFRLGSFPRFCTFDCFLRLAMIDPRLVGAAARLRQPLKPRVNIIPRYAPILASSLLSFFAVDRVAKPLK